ncbi:MAG: NADH-quinone oxidoreductase subunit N [Vampirovibrionales bacterium]
MMTAPLTLDWVGLFHQMQLSNLSFLAPELALVVTLLVLLGYAMSASAKQPALVCSTTGCDKTPLLMSVSGILVALVTLLTQAGLLSSNTYSVMQVFQVDGLSFTARVLILIGSLLVSMLLAKHVAVFSAKRQAEIFLLMLTAVLGSMLLTGASEMITLFVALETLSIPSYILVGLLQRGHAPSAEASLKYLIYGGVASAFLLLGFSFWYGLAGGVTTFADLAGVTVATGNQFGLFAGFTVVSILVALGFKLSAAPFHMWTPDVYEGAPTPVATFLGTVSKLAGFTVAFRLAALLGNIDMHAWQGVMLTLAIASMVVGNLAALKQTNAKRLLAYSTIAQSGYMLLGLVYPNVEVSSGMFFYLACYTFMSFAAFAGVTYFQELTGSKAALADFSGLVQKRPMLTFGLVVALLALAGIPVTSGFFAKFFLFESLAAIAQPSLTSPVPWATWLVIIALLNSTVSLFYYVGWVKTLVVDAPSDTVKALEVKPAITQGFQVNPSAVVLAVATLVTLVLGFTSESALTLMKKAVAPSLQQASVGQPASPVTVPAPMGMPQP